jgi:nitrate reductase NapAB chaperone NapD
VLFKLTVFSTSSLLYITIDMKTGKCTYIVVLLISTVFFSSCKSAAQKKSKTVKQIQAIENEKKARTNVEGKIDSQLLRALREKRGDKIDTAVNLLPANVNADAKGNLLVDISADVTDELLNKMKKLGANIIYPSKEYHTIRATVNLLTVEEIAQCSEVKFIAPAAVAQTNKVVSPQTIQATKASSDSSVKHLHDR